MLNLYIIEIIKINKNIYSYYTGIINLREILILINIYIYVLIKNIFTLNCYVLITILE